MRPAEYRGRHLRPPGGRRGQNGGLPGRRGGETQYPTIRAVNSKAVGPDARPLFKNSEDFLRRGEIKQ